MSTSKTVGDIVNEYGMLQVQRFLESLNEKQVKKQFVSRNGEEKIIITRMGNQNGLIIHSNSKIDLKDEDTKVWFNKVVKSLKNEMAMQKEICVLLGLPYSTSVETISLNQVIEEEFNDISPSYISIDTEGSEFEILNSFNFSKYKPAVFTIEHNFTDLQKKIDELMFKNDYSRIFNNLTTFDAWYISKKALHKMK